VEISYGARTNKDLLLHYGFCMEDNAHDYMEITLDMIAPPDVHLMVIDLEEIVDDRATLTIRLAKDALNEDLLDYIRYIMRKKFEKGKNLDYELVVISTYVEVVDILLQDEEQETTLAEDEKLYKEAKDPWIKMAIRYRIEKKKILYSQI
jgi:hypothetical protein